MKLFTIGYGGRTSASFLALVQPAGVRTIVDVRLRPDRASMGIWVKAKTADKGIEAWLTAAGIGYISLPELGNVFLDYPDSLERYAAFIDVAGPMLIERIHTIPGPICLMCAEKRIAECHRLAIADFLARHHGFDVQHLE